MSKAKSNLITQVKVVDIAHFVSARIFENASKSSIDGYTSANSLSENQLSRELFFKEHFESKMKTNSKIVILT